MYLDEVRIPVSNLLGEVDMGFLLAMKDFDMSRPAIGAQARGIAEGAFDQMLKHSKERKTFGQQLCEHQMIQQIIADSDTEIEASRLLTSKSVALVDKDLRGLVPTFLAINTGKVNDVKMLDKMPVQEDAIYAVYRSMLIVQNPEYTGHQIRN